MNEESEISKNEMPNVPEDQEVQGAQKVQESLESKNKDSNRNDRNNENNEKKPAFNYIKFVSLYTIILWAVFLIIIIKVKDPANYNIEMRDQGRIIQGIVYSTIGFLCLFMVILLYYLHRKRKKIVIIYLMGYFGFVGLMTLFQGVFGIIEFEVRNFQTFWTDSSFIFLTGALFCLGCFVNEVFQKGVDVEKNRRKLNIFMYSLILSDLFILLNQISSIPVYIVIFPFIIFIPLAIAYFFVLIIKSFALSKRMEHDIEKKAFILIGFHGVLLIFGAIFAALYSLGGSFNLRYFTAFLTGLAYLCLFSGFTLPMRHKKN